MSHREQAVELRPAWPEVRRALGFALVRIDRPADAVMHCEAWVRLAPCDPAAQAALTELRRAVAGAR